MSRKKNYKEYEVIEKAMHLFWRNGYEATSVRMLEKEMGINQFSIYSSFGNKEGVFIESLKCYKKKLQKEVDQLKFAQHGIESIKKYFFNFLRFSKENSPRNGCLMVNTINEFGDKADAFFQDEIAPFSDQLQSIFKEKIKSDLELEEAELQKLASFLSISLQGLSMATKTFEQNELENYIEMTFSVLRAKN